MKAKIRIVIKLRCFLCKKTTQHYLCSYEGLGEVFNTPHWHCTNCDDVTLYTVGGSE